MDIYLSIRSQHQYQGIELQVLYVVLLISAAVIVMGLLAFILWRYVLRKRRTDPDNSIGVTCSTCGTHTRFDRDNAPSKMVCPNCGKEGPVDLRRAVSR